MEENTQLPKEVVERIGKEADDLFDETMDSGTNLPMFQKLTAYATKLHQANETIKVLEYDNNRLKEEVEGLTSALDELRTKYDNILTTESGHESKTENVWQSGYAAGHDAGSEKRITAAAERIADKLMVIVRKQLGLDQPLSHELLQVICDAEKSKEEDLKAVKEVIGGTVVKIDREWVSNALVEFALAYHRMINKDIANDAAEYLNDKLNEAGVIYVLSEDESAAGREDAAEFVNWTLSSECDTYTCTDENQWTNIYTKESITTAELYELFKQQKEK